MPSDLLQRVSVCLASVMSPPAAAYCTKSENNNVPHHIIIMCVCVWNGHGVPERRHEDGVEFESHDGDGSEVEGSSQRDRAVVTEGFGTHALECKTGNERTMCRDGAEVISNHIEFFILDFKTFFQLLWIQRLGRQIEHPDSPRLSPSLSLSLSLNVRFLLTSCLSLSFAWEKKKGVLLYRVQEYRGRGSNSRPFGPAHSNLL